MWKNNPNSVSSSKKFIKEVTKAVAVQPIGYV